MVKVDEVIQDVIRRANESGFSVQGLSKLANLHKNTLRHMKKPGWEPSITTLRSLEKTLDRLDTQKLDELNALAQEKGIHKPRKKRATQAPPLADKLPTQKCAVR